MANKIAKKDNIFLRLWKWVKGLFSDKKEVNINKKINKNSNKGEKNAVFNIHIDNRIYNKYNNLPNKDEITSPNAVVENGKKDKEKELEKEERTSKRNQTESEEKSEKEQEMPRQEFERLLMKIKFITFGIMGNIKWDKVKLKFRKDESEKDIALLMFGVEERGCFIEYEITEKNKQEFLKTSAFKIVESFITQHLVNYGKNDYYDDKCPECKQTTLTRSLIKNSPNREEAIACNLCGWAHSMKTYLKFLNEKECNPFLKFPEWLDKHNKWWIK